MLRCTKSRCQWLTAKTMLILIVGSALFWLTPTASPAVMTDLFKPSWAPEKNAITAACDPYYITPGCGETANAPKPDPAPLASPPKASCQSKWCDRVRTTHRIARKLLAGLERWERTCRCTSPLSNMTVLLSIVRATRAENRSPFLTVAISGKESSFGTAYPCRSPNGDGAGRYNLTGLASCWAPGNWKMITLCGRTFNGPSYVTSYARGMGLTARLIRCLVPNARTVYEINNYAASSTWKPAVHSIMVNLFRVPDHVMWQAAVKVVR